MSETRSVHEDVIIETSVMVPMRDDIRLTTDIYRPAGTEKVPVLLHRLPYGQAVGRYFDAAAFARHGYALVIQQCRGCFGSEGDFHPWPVRHEIDDGYDAVEWAAAQPWSNGKVGMFGGSYAGHTQYAAAMAKPPHLVAIAPAAACADFFDGMPYLGPGILAHESVVSFWTLMAANTARTAAIEEPVLSSFPTGVEMTDAEAAGIEAMMALVLRIRGLLEPLMREPLRKLYPELVPWLADWIDHPDPADLFWRRFAPAAHYEEIALPALHITGWYDSLLQGTLRNYLGLARLAPTEEARSGQRLVIGPWDHQSVGRAQGGRQMGQVGMVRFFEDVVTDIAETDMVRFLDRWLRGIDDDTENGAPVRLFVMGDNAWRDEWEWPLARTEWTSWYLRSGGSANTLEGDGSLSHEPSREEHFDSFEYDPANPVPSRGGPSGAFVNFPGAWEQRDIEVRPDVLCYTSGPLPQDLEITGPVSLELWASSSAPDTDFTAKLVDVGSDGTAINICEGIVQARRASGRLLEPGAVHRFEIDVSATSTVFKAGHRVRLDVSSSSFPAAYPNPNTGGDRYDDGGPRAASQRVFHDAQHPSRLILPVIPR